MKTITLIIAFLLAFASGNMMAQIPNADFENWHFGGWFENPDDWTTNNSQLGSVDIAKDTDAYHGVYAMKLHNWAGVKPWARTSFVTSMPPAYLVAYVKCILAYNDTVGIKIVLFNNGLPVDSGQWMGTSDISSYEQVKIPISNNSLFIDSVSIEIEGGSHVGYVGSDFFVDNLSLDFTSGINNPEKEKEIYVFPNPTSKNITLRIPEEFNKQVKLKILNSIGSCILEQNVSKEETIDLSRLAKGMYVVRIESENIVVCESKIILIN